MTTLDPAANAMPTDSLRFIPPTTQTNTIVIWTTYRILPIIGASPNKGAPIVWGTQYCPEGLK